MQKIGNLSHCRRLTRITSFFRLTLAESGDWRTSAKYTPPARLAGLPAWTRTNSAKLPARAEPTSPTISAASRKIVPLPPKRAGKVAARWRRNRAVLHKTAPWPPQQGARAGKPHKAGVCGAAATAPTIGAGITLQKIPAGPSEQNAADASGRAVLSHRQRKKGLTMVSPGAPVCQAFA